MPFEAHCDPDVDAECDACGESINDERIYCSSCYEGVVSKRNNSEGQDCARCHRTFVRDRMISKVAGIMCRECAHSHELELLAALQPAKAS